MRERSRQPSGFLSVSLFTRDVSQRGRLPGSGSNARSRLYDANERLTGISVPLMCRRSRRVF